MSEAEDRMNVSNRNIPKLNDQNYAMWSMRMKAHLRAKGLLKVCTSEPTDVSMLSGAALTNANKKRNEAVDILMNYMGDDAFNAVITPENDEKPHLIWSKIISRYASQSVNKKGRVWLKFMRFEYNGNLKDYIVECTKLINGISIVKLGVPDDVLCYSILAKLSKNLWNVVDNIIMNEELVKHPDATLAKLQEMVYLDESRREINNKVTTVKSEPEEVTALYKSFDKKRKTFRKPDAKSSKIDPARVCENGKHNKNAFHPEDLCYKLHP